MVVVTVTDQAAVNMLIATVHSWLQLQLWFRVRTNTVILAVTKADTVMVTDR